jgi:hypothetical protein
MPSVRRYPAHPERVCWGCEKYCPAEDLACGNGTIRTPHPRELFGSDWMEWMELRRQGRREGDSRANVPSVASRIER